MKRIDRFFEAVSNGCCWLLIAAGITMSVLTFITAIARKVGISALTWTDEVNRYCFIYMTYIGMVVCSQKGKHAAVDLLFDHVGQRLRAVLVIIGDLLIIAFLYIMFTGAVKMLSTAGITLSPVLHIPLSVIYVSLLVGSVLTMLVYLWQIIKSALYVCGGVKGGDGTC